jgi:hypothetical protein
MSLTTAVRRVSVCLLVTMAASCGGDHSGITAPDTPASTPNFVRLQSDAGDYIGAGGSYDYSRANAVLSLTATAGHLELRISGDQSWWADFQSPSAMARLTVGSYTGLQRYPFNDAAKGGLSWWGEGRGCNTLVGSFTIDSVTYQADILTAIDLHFDQHCEGGTAALRGTIHWRADDTSGPPGPVVPIPTTLWRPSAGATPTGKNFVYLKSDVGDYIGGGQTATLTQADAIFTMTATGGHLTVGVTGWGGDFQTMNSVSQLQPGYYADMRRSSPVKGGFDWRGGGRACNTITGWFAVDSVTYSGSTLTAIDLRFEQHCEGTSAALHGAIHWRNDDATAPPGPIVPVPGSLWKPAAGATPTGKNYVFLQSDVGDNVGGGQTYSYTQADAILSVAATAGKLGVTVAGWTGSFQTMFGVGPLQAGYYGDLSRYPVHNPVKGGLDWSGNGRGCNTLTGWFAIDSLTYSGGTLTAIDLRFEQRCDGANPALHGAIHWRNDDPTAPPGPVLPVPATLWQPAAGVTPIGKNFVYLQSDANDAVGGGQTSTFTQANAILSVSASGGHLTVGVGGWNGNLQTMNVVNKLQPGYYGDLTRYPFHNPVKGGLDWSNNGRACNTLIGWFAIDSLTYSGSTLTAIDVRFEQRCEGGTAALHGAIHWRNDDPTMPPGPVVPVPTTLWQPAAGATPTGKNFVYLQSDAGDYIGAGQTSTQTQADAVLSVSANGGHLVVGVTGWTGDFQTMNSISQLQAGYYGDLSRYPFHNVIKGGLSWSGNGRGCNTLTGWFAIDSLTYVGSTLTAIDLRFEQHCEGLGPALHGAIHWRADDPTAPPGPVLPMPTGLWQPPAGSTPATGNSVYLQSDAGDYIGAGQTYSYAAPTSTITLSANGGHLSVGVGGWIGDFQTMNTLSQIQPGYYGNLTRYPFQNPAKGGLSWSGNGRGCNTLSGWFAVDRVVYTAGTLTAIDLRFEQHCEGGATALHGVVHWGS